MSLKDLTESINDLMIFNQEMRVQNRKKVFECVLQKDKSSILEIKKAQKLSYPAIYRHIHSMINKGFLQEEKILMNNSCLISVTPLGKKLYDISKIYKINN